MPGTNRHITHTHDYGMFDSAGYNTRNTYMNFWECSVMSTRALNESRSNTAISALIKEGLKITREPFRVQA